MKATSTANDGGDNGGDHGLHMRRQQQKKPNSDGDGG